MAGYDQVPHDHAALQNAVSADDLAAMPFDLSCHAGQRALRNNGVVSYMRERGPQSGVGIFEVGEPYVDKIA